MIKRSLFLDLEGTIIESMDNPMILENIREEWFTRLIAEADEIHMFSWAITSDADIASSLWLIRHVEETIGIKFTSIVKRDDFFAFFRRKFGNIELFEMEEICRSLGKETVFQMFVRNIFANPNGCEIFSLVDDMVEDTILSVAGKRIETIKVG